MEIVRHIFGMCEDNQAHIDIIDILAIGFGAACAGLVWIKYQIKTVLYIIGEKFSTKR